MINKAMILAAGLGTRLRPLTNQKPKPLIEVDGLPLIFYNLALLKKYGFRKVVINLYHLGEQIEELLGDGKKFGFEFSYSYEPEILGTGGGIKFAEKFLENEDFLVLNSDIICDIDLSALIKKFSDQKVMATMALKKLPIDSKLSVIEIDENDQVVSIIKPSNVKNNLQKSFFTGLHVLSANIFNILPKTYPSCIIRDGYLPILDEGLKINSLLVDSFWSDCGTIEVLEEIRDKFSRGKIFLSYQDQLREFKKVLEVKN